MHRVGRSPRPSTSSYVRSWLILLVDYLGEGLLVGAFDVSSEVTLPVAGKLA